MNIGKLIRQRREKLNLKQTDLANALMVSPQAVSKWERGETCPDISYLLSLSRLLDVSTDYLLGASEIEHGDFEATVLCSSISGFAVKSLAMDSREVAEWANSVFFHLTEAVLKYDAIPIKYVGDGFLCFFSGPDHAQRAFNAASYAKKTIQNNSLKISLNSGKIYLGTIGHPDYCSRDIYGQTVNLGFLMLEHIARKCTSGIGIGPMTAQLIQSNVALSRHEGNFIELIEKEICIFEPQNQ